MKKDYCDITMLLDKSGSMYGVVSDTIGGVNSFIDKQRLVKGECKLSIYQFDDIYETTYEVSDIQSCGKLTTENYQTRGSTALLDAIGKTIINLGKRLDNLTEDKKPEQVVVVIQTDGEENASKEFTREKIFDMISHQRDKYNWQFIFMGANQDAISTAKSYGISASSALTYANNSAGNFFAYSGVACNIASYRAGTTSDTSFTDTDRTLQEQQLNN
jgi:uncharacterized protein YegL